MNLETALRATTRATRSALLAAETYGRARMEPHGNGAGRRLRALPDGAARLRICAATALDVHGIRVHHEGAPPETGSVVVANHRSWLDPLVLLALAPGAPIAKAEVARWPIVGPLTSSLGDEMAWMTLYFSFAVWMSLALARAPRFRSASGM